MFSSTELVCVLSIDRDPNDTHLKTFPNLRCLEINGVQEITMLRILQFACDDIGHRLSKLHCNLDRLTHTAYRPDAAGLAYFERLYGCLKNANVKHDLEIFFHGVRLDTKLEFADYRFNEKLVNVYHHNHVINGLKLAHCRTVRCARYMDVLDTFFGRGPHRDEAQRTKLNYGLLRFSQVFSNVRIVVLDNEHTRRQLIEPLSFLQFLKHCRALTELSIRFSGFPADFYPLLAEVESLKTLSGFFLSEPLAYRSTERINFAFVGRFEQLRRFSTNLAIASVMFDLVAEMPVSAEFRFRFWNPLEGFAFYHCKIVRRLPVGEAEKDVVKDVVNDVVKEAVKKAAKEAEKEAEEKEAKKEESSMYELTVRLKDTRDQSSQRELHHAVLSGDELRNFFARQENLSITSHWLDSVPEHSI